MKTITVDGVKYVPATEAKSSVPASTLEGLKYVLVRTENMGVFAGYLKSRKGSEGVLLRSRRIWYWKGAASLSQLAVDGVSCPDECKFPCEIEGEHEVVGIGEVIPVTKKAQESIASVPVWKN